MSSNNEDAILKLLERIAISLEKFVEQNKRVLALYEEKWK